MAFVEFTKNQMMRISIRHFKLIDLLGEGAFGSVWKAKYIPTGKKYALKIIRKEFAPENIIEACDISLKLNHPNFVKVYDYFYERFAPPGVGIHEHLHIVVIMEYIEGVDLYAKILENNTDNIIDKYLPQMVSAIEYLLDNGFIHRDFKPENMLITRDDILKITDYDFLTNNFRAQGRLGTPYYAAPEIYIQEFYNYKVDIWSLGIILWCCICLDMPFDAKSRGSLRDKIIKEEPDWNLVKNNKYYPLLRKMLIKNPKERIGIKKIKMFLINNI